MKQIVFSAIIALVIGLIIAYFGFALNKEFVDLRYTLSEKIPTKLIETSTAETVQQLVVKNNGNIPATRIQITIDGLIEDHDILKNSLSDIVEEHNPKGHFEAIYPSLPPGGQFSYILKTSGGGITKDNLEIKHNKGKAREALASDSQSIYSKIGISVFFSAIFIFYIILIVFQGRSMAIDHLESSGTYTNYYDYLNKKKPIYVSQEKWDSIRRKYIEGKIKAQYLLDCINIEVEENYKILNQDKPKYLTENEWELLKENASKSLEDQLSYSIKTSSTFTNIKKYFTLKKPKHFPENKWNEIIKEANENFITVQKLKKFFYLSTKDIIKELEVGIPTGMLPTFRDEYKESLRDRYYEIVYREILREFNSLKYLEEIDLSVLSKDKQESLKDLAYRIQLLRVDDISSLYNAEKFIKNDKPEWIKQDDLEKLEEKAKAYVALEKSIRKNESLSKALDNIVNLTPLKDRPGALDTNEWERVIELESKIATTAIKIEEDKSKLESEKQKTKNLKAKILKQLIIIDDVLNDPESINKIEDYDNPFSEGNFTNLQKVSKYAIELQKIT
jgi:hypothetical protein